MKQPWVAFEKSAMGVAFLAVFCAQLTKENVSYIIKQDDVGYEVHITGY